MQRRCLFWLGLLITCRWRMQQPTEVWKKLCVWRIRHCLFLHQHHCWMKLLLLRDTWHALPWKHSLTLVVWDTWHALPTGEHCLTLVVEDIWHTLPIEKHCLTLVVWDTWHALPKWKHSLTCLSWDTWNMLPKGKHCLTCVGLVKVVRKLCIQIHSYGWFPSWFATWFIRWIVHWFFKLKPMLFLNLISCNRAHACECICMTCQKKDCNQHQEHWKSCHCSSIFCFSMLQLFFLTQSVFVLLV